MPTALLGFAGTCTHISPAPQSSLKTSALKCPPPPWHLQVPESTCPVPSFPMCRLLHVHASGPLCYLQAQHLHARCLPSSLYGLPLTHTHWHNLPSPHTCTHMPTAPSLVYSHFHSQANCTSMSSAGNCIRAQLPTRFFAGTRTQNAHCTSLSSEDIRHLRCTAPLCPLKDTALNLPSSRGEHLPSHAHCPICVLL